MKNCKMSISNKLLKCVFSRLAGVSESHYKTNGTCPIYKHLCFQPDKRQQVWRFVTYMFVHGGIHHILFNLSIQLLLGIPLELVHCWWRVALVYLSGVLAGSMAASFTKRGLIGASGGVYALITAHIATIVMNWHEMEHGMLQLFLFLILCSSNIGSEVYQHNINSANDISHLAHLSGGFAGLLVGIGVLRNLNVRPFERVVWFAAVGIYAALITVAILYNVLV